MIVYFDSNVYIAAHYHFDSDKFAKLRSLVDTGDVSILYTSATLNEVKQHMYEDIDKEVTYFNRILRKDTVIIKNDSSFLMNELDASTIKEHFTSKLISFFSMDGVVQIPLNPLNGEELMADYFERKAPFEAKKPSEFKDAIMINAVKRYQAEKNELILVVSSDDGFRRAFQDEKKYLCFQYLGDLLKYINRYNGIQTLVDKAISEGQADTAIESFLLDLSVDRSDLSEWDCDDCRIPKISTTLLFTEMSSERTYAVVDVEAMVQVRITYRDEDQSYFDKEDRCYYFEKIMTVKETHCINFEIRLLCEIVTEPVPAVITFTVEDISQLSKIDLDESTLKFSKEEQESSVQNENLIYCSECGKPIGLESPYQTYDGKPLCSECMVDDEQGFVCPICGEKYPHEYDTTGYCPSCAEMFDK